MKQKHNNPLSRRKFLSTTALGFGGATLFANKITNVPFYISNTTKSQGVKLGMITYSLRSQEDQSALAILAAVKECGIKHVELMGAHAEHFAGKPLLKIDRSNLYRLYRAQQSGKLTTAEKKEFDEAQKIIAAHQQEVAQWDKEKALKKMEELRNIYDAEGVSIYAYKPDFLRQGNTDEDITFAMQCAKILGASHVTIELPEDPAHSQKLGNLAQQVGIYVAYHGHEQQHPNWWDTALEQSPNNAINLDLGHYVAAGNLQPLQFIRQQHKMIKSMHVKDRRNPANGKENLPFGQGDTPIVEALQLIRNENMKIIPTLEYEYQTPEGSDVISELKKCIAYCQNALDS